MFRATPDDIDKFIKESPSIQNSKPEIFNSEHRYLPSPQNSDYNPNDKFFGRNNDWPEWYDITIKHSGRYFEIPPVNQHNWGMVIINDETKPVYIQLIWS